jgi:Tol biopolymer transport system component
MDWGGVCVLLKAPHRTLISALAVAIVFSAAAGVEEASASPSPVAALSFDEGEGAIAHDSAGHHNGVIHGARWTKSGKYGAALDFDGGEDIVTIPDSEALDLTEGFTLEAWVRPDGNFGGLPSVLVKEDSEASFSYILSAAWGEEGPSGTLHGAEFTEATVKDPELLLAQSWSHLALTSDGEEMRLYVDGELVETGPAVPLVESDGALQIGGMILGGRFEGKIDEIRLYDEALGAEEIEEDRDTAIKAPIYAKPTVALSFDEDKGEFARDSAGHDGRIHGAKWTKQGKYGAALEFDGESDHVTIPDSSALDFTEGFTLEAWVDPSEAHEWSSLIAKEDSTEALPFSYLLYGQGGGEAPVLYTAEDESEYTHNEGETPLPLNAWSHLAVTFDGEHSRIYIDGKLDSVGPALPVKATKGPLQIGGNEVFGEHFAGRIDEVRLYDEALGPEDIEEDGDVPIKAAPAPKPSAAYPFDEDEGEVAHDLSGKHNGTVHGAEWTEAGKYGAALEFNGESDHVTVPASGELDFTEGFTLEAWVDPSEAHNWSSLIAKEDSTEKLPFGYLLYGEGGLEAPAFYAAEDESTFEHINGTKALPTNAWSYLTVTSDGEEMRLYVNGELEETGPSVPVKATKGPLQIGGNEVFGEHFAGRVDEVRLYGQVLGGEEIEEDQGIGVLEGFDVSAEGKAAVGETLKAVPGLWPGPTAPAEYEYQWQRCDSEGEECKDIEGARRRSYVLGSADLGHKLRVSLTVGPSPEMSVRSAPSSQVVELEPAPYTESTPLIFGHVAQNRTLSAFSERGWQPESTTISYQWRRCDEKGKGCADIGGAEGQNYLVQSSDVGSTLRVAVTGTTSGGSASRVSEPTEVVTVAALENISAPTVNESGGTFGTRLIADPGKWSEEEEISFHYQWQRCDAEGGGCVDITEGTAADYFPLEEDAESRFRVEVTAVIPNARESATSALSTVIEAVKPASTAAPAITGRPRMGETLEADTGTWSGPGPLALEMQWQRCNVEGEECEAIEGATEQDLELSPEDVGSTIRLLVNAGNEIGNASAESMATEVIAGKAGPAPELVSPPAISGETEVGEELIGSPGVWSGAIEYLYQWERCSATGGGCEPIAEAGEATYVLTKDDVGHEVKLAVIALAEDESAADAFAITTQSVRAIGAPANTEAPALEGVAKVGKTLSATTGSWAGVGPITYAYAWQRCEAGECSDIEGATASTYTLTSEDVLHAVRAVVTAENASGETTAVSVPSASVDSVAPFDETAPTISGGDRVGDTLSAAHGTWNGEATISYAYQWQRCDSAGASCADIPGEEGSSYELASADAGASVRVAVTASNSHGEAQASSAPSVPISDATGPILSAAPTISGTPEATEALTATHGSWEGAETYAYQWQRCAVEAGPPACANIEAATTSIYTATYADVGAQLRVAVSATGGGGTAIALSEPTAEVEPSLEPGKEEDSLANTAPPTLSGKAEETQTLTAEPGTWSSYLPVSFEYQWRRCNAGGAQCANIEGATSSTYVPQETDIGATVRAFVIASNGPRGRVVQTKASAVIAQAPPANVSAPTVYAENGEMVDGEVLRLEAGAWSGSGLSFEYQWQLCDAEGKSCEDLEEEASGESYEVRSSEVGSTLRVVETAKNTIGSKSVTSAATAVIGQRAPSNEYPPQIFGDALQDGILEAYPGSWRGTPELGFTYQWLRCNEEGEECEAITEATEPSYAAQAADVGQTLRVEVTATNEAGSAEATSPPSEVIGSPLVPVLEGAPPAITGFLFDGRALNAESGEWGGHQPIEFAYQWLRCNEEGEACEAIAKANEVTYLTSGGDLGKRLRVKVTATNTSGTASEVSEATEAITSEALINVSAPWISGGQRPGTELEASPGEWSGSGPIEFAYQWQRCTVEGEECEAIEGAEEVTYTAGAEDARHALRVLVTATGPLGGEAASSESHRILPKESESKSPPIISGTLAEGKTLSATSGEWSPEPDQYRYQWQECSAAGTGCFDTGITSSEYTLPSGSGVTEKTFRVRVLAYDEGEEEWESPREFSATTGVVTTKVPVNKAAPTLSLTTPTVGEAVSASPGTWSGETPLTYSYQWQRCFTTSPSSCEDIEGAASSSFTPSNSWVNRRIRVEVRAENANGNNVAASAISQKIAEGPPEPPQNLTLPKVLGPAVEGSELEAGPGNWSEPFEFLSFSYEWRRCNEEGNSCTAISGAVKGTYKSSPADVGHTLRVVVIARSTTGEESESATSAPSAVVIAAVRPEVDAAPEIEGTAEVSKLLIADHGVWRGTLEIHFDYLWKRCDSAGRRCSAISGAEEGSYTPRRADIGSTIRLQVSATNSWGSVSASSDPTAIVPGPAPIANVEPARLEPWWIAPEFGVAYQADQLGEWEGEPAIAVRWQRCDPLTEEPESGEMECVDIAGAEDADEYIPQKADVGFKLRLKEIATVPGEEAFAFSKPTEEVVLASIAKGKGSYSGPLMPGSTITADSTVTSEAGLPVSVDYKFLRLGEEGPEELQDGSSPSYEIVEADLGYELKVEMTASIMRADEAEVLAMRSVSVTTGKVEVPPTNDVLPSISGEAASGATLKAEPGEWHGGGGPLSYAFQWRRCDEEGKVCADISAATKATYTLTSEDIGSTLRVAVIAASGFFKETATSEPSSVVTPAVAPSNEEAPSISGELAELGTVEASEGAWGGSEPITYAYQWQGCESEAVESCLDIAGETGATLALDQIETGQWLRVVVKATNPGGSAAAASEIVGPVAQAPPPKLNEVPSLSVLGPPSVGSTLMTDGGLWEHVDPSTLEYQWMRCDSSGELCVVIAEADQSSYDLGEEDLGATVKVEVTAANSSGKLSATSEPSPEIDEDGGSAGGKVVYLNRSRSAVFLSDLEGESNEEVADCSAITGEVKCTLRHPSISPNGKLIAVEERNSETSVGSGTIFLMNFDGTEVRELAEGSDPDWSKDGTRLLYVAPNPEEPLGTRIVEVAADGSNSSEPTSLTESARTQESPDVSSDGTRLTYAGLKAKEPSGIYVAAADGSHSVRLKLDARIADAFTPSFTADGSQIVFTATSPTDNLSLGLRRVWIVDPNGSDLHPITPDQSVSSHTYSALTNSPSGLISSRETVTVTLFGGGVSIDYSPPTIWSLGVEGANAHSMSITGLEPDYRSATATTSANVNRRCLEESPCGTFDGARAARYAEYWADETHPRNPYYHDFGSNNCTNFVSQVIARGGMNFMRAFEYGDGSWWYRKFYVPQYPEQSPYDATESWTAADILPRHLWQYGLAKIDSSDQPSGWTRGNILAYDWYGTEGKGDFNHLQFVVGTYTPNGEPREPVIANSSSPGTNYGHLRWRFVKKRIQESEGLPAGKPGWDRVPLTVTHTVAELDAKVHDPDNLYGPGGVFGG